MTRSRLRPNALSWLLVAAYAVLLFRTLGDGHLEFIDSSLTAERSRETLLTGRYFDTHLNFEPDPRKPPLHYGQTALALALIEDPELAVRLWSALYGVGCMVLLLALSRALAPDRPWTHAIVLVFFMVCAYFFRHSRQALLDSGATFYLLATVLGAWRARFDPRWWWLAAGGVVLGGLQKVPFGLLYLGLDGVVRLTTLPRARPSRAAVGAAIATLLGLLAWPVAQAGQHGLGFIAETIHREAWQDLVRDSPRVTVLGAASRIAEMVALGWGGVGLCALAAPFICLALRRLRARPLALVLSIWCAAYLVALASIGKQNPRYLMPVSPLLALLAAYCATTLLGSRRRLLAAAMALLLVASVLPARRILAPKHRVHDDEVALARQLGASLVGSERPVVVSPRRHFGLNPAFVLYYGDLRQPVGVLDPELRHPWLTASPPSGTRLRGVARRQDETFLRGTVTELRIERSFGPYVLFTAIQPESSHVVSRARVRRPLDLAPISVGERIGRP